MRASQKAPRGLTFQRLQTQPILDPKFRLGRSSGLFGSALFSVTPRLILNPSTGPAGSTAAAQWYGFGAGETVKVWWYNSTLPWNSVFLGTATADGRGRFPPLTVTIPAGAAPGTNPVIGKGMTTWAIGKGRFTVQ